MKLFNKLFLAATSIFVAASASAAVPTGVDTAITNLQADATATIELVIPAVIAITSLFIIVRVVKKVLNKVG